MAFRNLRSEKLWARYQCAHHGRAIIKRAYLWETEDSMALESTRKDNLKVEKASLLALALCIVVLAYLLIFRPFY
jgi:hypothetical protein